MFSEAFHTENDALNVVNRLSYFSFISSQSNTRACYKFQTNGRPLCGAVYKHSQPFYYGYQRLVKIRWLFLLFRVIQNYNHPFGYSGLFLAKIMKNI